MGGEGDNHGTLRGQWRRRGGSTEVCQLELEVPVDTKGFPEDTKGSDSIVDTVQAKSSQRIAEHPRQPTHP